MKVPEALYGEYKQVRKRWRAATRAAYRGGSWDVALAEEPMVDLGNIDGLLILQGPRSLLGQHVFLYPVMTELIDQSAYDYEHADEAGHRMKELMIDGMCRPWFLLALLGGDPLWLLGTNEFRDLESPRLAALALHNLLAKLPVFLSLDDRFANWFGGLTPWPGWQNRFFQLCVLIRVPESEIRPVRIASGHREIDIWEAAEHMKSWLVRWRKANAEIDLIRDPS